MTRPTRSAHFLPSIWRLAALLLAFFVLGGPIWVQTAAAAGTWSATGDLLTGRYQHTATLLPDGRVLVAGGWGGNHSAELYDPGTGLWSPTGDLAGAPRGHSATLLPTGRVLVAGGYDGSKRLRTAELYDPQTGLWSATASMAGAREAHTATLLADGRVLVVGGQSGPNSSSNGAEVYDPATGTWTATGTLNLRRAFHTATLLADGRVLVAGGYNLASATWPRRSEVYDPATGTWGLTGNLATGRSTHTATLLPDGRVLVAGGWNGAYLASAEVYDPATGLWSATGDLATGRHAHSATLLPDGQVLVAAGDNYGPLASAERYDPESGTWNATGDLGQGRYYHTASLLAGGRVLVAGGWDGLRSAELYEPAAGAWARTGSLASGRDYPTATLLADGRVLVAGGSDGGTSYFATTELYDPAAGTWSATGDLLTGRHLHTATLLADGRVLVAGGRDGTSYLATAEIYDPVAGTWSATGALAIGRVYHTATLLADGRVLVAGGNGVGYQHLASAELYDPATGTWSATGAIAIGRWVHTATLLSDGRVLVAGGADAAAVLRRAELYNPVTGLWSPAGTLITPRISHSATLLPDGRVLVAGGENGSTAPRGLRSAEVYDPATRTWSATGMLATRRIAHTATLLAGGRVLVAGGVWGYLGGAYYYPRGTEVYDPATGVWSAAGMLSFARYAHSAALLLDGRVLLAGGVNQTGGAYYYPRVAEVYDRGLDYAPAWRPVLATVSDPVPLDTPLEIGGTHLRGLSQGSAGNAQDSPTNYPLVQLRHLDSGRVLWLRPDPAGGFSDTAFRSAPLPDFPRGPALVTVLANAIPGESRLVQVAAEPALQVSFTAASQTVGEGVGTATITVQLSRPSGHTITVPYTVGGTATGGGVDYSLPASPLTIPAGATSATLALTVVNDALDEANETVVLTLWKPSHGTKQVPWVHKLTITDDDPLPQVSFTAATQTVGEAAGSASITVQLSVPSGRTVTLPYTLGGTATGGGVDYSLPASPLTIPPGDTGASLTLTVVNDTLDEPNETVVLTMGVPTNAAKVAPMTHRVTLIDDDP